MKILITGGTGLIGQYLLDELRGTNNEIFYTTRNVSQHKELNLNPVPVNLASVNFSQNFPKQMDCIIHLAQSEFYQNFPKNIDDVFSVNLGATHELLDYSYRSGVKNFIYASSGGVYNAKNRALKESDPLKKTDDLGHYIATKMSSEILIAQFNNFFNAQIMRIFFAYGPKQPKRMLIPRVINNIYRGNEIMISGDQGLTINPIHGQDVAKSITSLIYLENSSIFNIAGPEQINLIEIVRIIESELNVKANIKYSEESNIKLIGDNKKMVELLHNPKIKMLEGIREIIEKNYSYS